MGITTSHSLSLCLSHAARKPSTLHSSHLISLTSKPCRDGQTTTKGFSLLELLVVVGVLAILATFATLTLVSHRRMVKTDDAANAIYMVMRQARIQAITRRQFYALVINKASTNTTFTPNNSMSLTFLPQSINLIDMGKKVTGDEKISFSKPFPLDIYFNDSAILTSTNDLPLPEKNFNTAIFSGNGILAYYFDPAGRLVNKADGTGSPVYANILFSSSDINLLKGSTLMRTLTVYGPTGGLKLWRYVPTSTPKWVAKLN